MMKVGPFHKLHAYLSTEAIAGPFREPAPLNDRLIVGWTLEQHIQGKQLF